MDSSNRRPCFVEYDHGLASIAGFSGYNNTNINNNDNNKTNENGGAGVDGVGPVLMMRRRNSLRNMSCISSTVSSPRSVASSRVIDPRFEDHTPHFLESCFLCRKPLGGNRDIFMYRGDTPFCSVECRQEQIDKDEAKEKSRNFKAMRSKKDPSASSKSTTSPSSSPKRQNYPFRTGTVAAA